MPRKFRKPKKDSKRTSRSIIPLKPNKKIEPKKIRRIPTEFYLSEEDKVIYLYEVYENGTVAEVINVSYQVLINSDWITILRFDTHHGFLHGHMRISIGNPMEISFTATVKKSGNPHVLLTWAVERVKKSYLDYKRGFLKRSKRIDKRE
jgi:hypothetical protein